MAAMQKKVTPSKLKNIDFSREDFGREKKKRKLVSTPKKTFNPLVDSQLKMISLQDIAKALEGISPNSIVHSAVPKPEIDFVIESVNVQKPSILSVHNVLEMANSRKEFFDYLQQMTNNVEEIEKSTRRQNNNTLWFEFRKGVITASKCHDILTKMMKVLKGGGRCIDMYSVNQKVSGLTQTQIFQL